MYYIGIDLHHNNFVVGQRGHNRAIVATTRKLLELIYDVLKTGRPSKDFSKDPYHYPASVKLTK